MSAVIGILNKHGIALAADSAVTISGGGNRKILNSANKIFTLSKHHPIGIMIYSSAEFMGTPWEIIAKMYREQLGTKSFKKVDDYRKDFIKYLKDNEFFSDEQDQLQTLSNFFYTCLNQLNREAIHNNEKLLIKPDKQNTDKIYSLIEKRAEHYITQFKDEKPCNDFKNYTFKTFQGFSKKTFGQVTEVLFEELDHQPTQKLKALLHEFLFLCLKSKSLLELQPFSGLVFVGYGDAQIYPHLVPVNIMLAVQGKLRACVDENKSAHISNKMHSVISPFAQTDVIDTILRGVDPDLERIYQENFSAFLIKYNNFIAEKADNESKELADTIRSLNVNELTRSYFRDVNQMQQTTYIDKMLQTVSSLPKEDLAEMAESLIYLTYLKRRITFAEESVGGPVDVALITKGDGFIWMKRKHYFNPELNHHFFKGYLK
jgi:hypothetical protein